VLSELSTLRVCLQTFPRALWKQVHLAAAVPGWWIIGTHRVEELQTDAVSEPADGSWTAPTLIFSASRNEAATSFSFSQFLFKPTAFRCCLCKQISFMVRCTNQSILRLRSIIFPIRKPPCTCKQSFDHGF